MLDSPSDCLCRFLEQSLLRLSLDSQQKGIVAKCSSDTALRDIKELVEYNILKLGEAGGRSTSYALTQTPNE